MDSGFFCPVTFISTLSVSIDSGEMTDNSYQLNERGRLIIELVLNQCLTLILLMKW